MAQPISLIAHNWKWFTLRGVLALLFGLLTIAFPKITLLTLLVLFGGFAIFDGVLLVASSLANRQDEPRWGALLVTGLLGIAVGVLTFVLPRITALSLLYLIGAWAFVLGIGEIVAAIRLRRFIHGEWLLMLGGALSVVFGLLLFWRPGTGALALALWIGAWAIVEGVLLLGLAFRLRRWERSGTSMTHAHA